MMMMMIVVFVFEIIMTYESDDNDDDDCHYYHNANYERSNACEFTIRFVILVFSDIAHATWSSSLYSVLLKVTTDTELYNELFMANEKEGVVKAFAHIALKIQIVCTEMIMIMMFFVVFVVLFSFPSSSSSSSSTIIISSLFIHSFIHSFIIIHSQKSRAIRNPPNILSVVWSQIFINEVNGIYQILVMVIPLIQF